MRLSLVNVAISEPITEATTKSIVEQKLKLVEEPALKSGVVIYSENGTLPLFRGEGNISFLCGQCRAILVDRGWRFSISNLIVKCPSCQSYNEFPKLRLPEQPIIGTIAIMKENYNFTGTVNLRRGVTMVGL